MNLQEAVSRAKTNEGKILVPFSTGRMLGIQVAVSGVESIAWMQFDRNVKVWSRRSNQWIGASEGHERGFVLNLDAMTMSYTFGECGNLFVDEFVDITHRHSFRFRHSPTSTCALSTDRVLVVMTISSFGSRKER